MTLMIIVVVSAMVGSLYALSLKRGEERRQEWRQNSRASWIKG